MIENHIGSAREKAHCRDQKENRQRRPKGRKKQGSARHANLSGRKFRPALQSRSSRAATLRRSRSCHLRVAAESVNKTAAPFLGRRLAKNIYSLPRKRRQHAWRFRSRQSFFLDASRAITTKMNEITYEVGVIMQEPRLGGGVKAWSNPETKTIEAGGISDAESRFREWAKTDEGRKRLWIAWRIIGIKKLQEFHADGGRADHTEQATGQK